VKTASPTRVAIACQGGGSHTAFAAGVLKGVLQLVSRSIRNPDDELEIVALSGISGGAICALLAWDGLLHEEPERGIARLEGFWQDVATSDPFSALVNDALQVALRLRNFVAFPEVNPYALPPWGAGPVAGAAEA